MDILYLLIPMTALLVLGILLVFAWALQRGQFDDLEQQGELILDRDSTAFDPRQAAPVPATEESPSYLKERSEQR